MSSSIQKHLYFSKAFLRESEPAEEDWLEICLILTKQTRSWSDTLHYEISRESTRTENFLIRYFSFNHRRGYSNCMSRQLSELGVPLEQHPPILEKLFQAVEAAVLGQRIVVCIADVTVQSDDHDNTADISGLIRMCCPVNTTIGYKATEESEVSIEIYTLSEIDCHCVDADRVTWESFEAQKIRFVPATTSSINSLQRVRLDVLEEATIKQNPSCVICGDYFAVAGVDRPITPLPCAHIYHLDCIVPWLKTSHLCPVCRYPMPTVEES